VRPLPFCWLAQQNCFISCLASMSNVAHTTGPLEPPFSRVTSNETERLAVARKNAANSADVASGTEAPARGPRRHSSSAIGTQITDVGSRRRQHHAASRSPAPEAFRERPPRPVQVSRLRGRTRLRNSSAAPRPPNDLTSTTTSRPTALRRVETRYRVTTDDAVRRRRPRRRRPRHRPGP